MISQGYNEGFKEMAVKKLLSLNSNGLNSTAREIGVASSTLFNWRKKYANSSSMNNSKKKNNKWTPERKLQVIAETLSFSEKELGEYLRRNGLYSSELEEWKKSFYNSQNNIGRPKKDPEMDNLKKEKNALSKNLRRKDKALAEMSARVVLLKKSHLIFGVDEDEE